MNKQKIRKIAMLVTLSMLICCLIKPISVSAAGPGTTTYLYIPNNGWTQGILVHGQTVIRTTQRGNSITSIVSQEEKIDEFANYSKNKATYKKTFTYTVTGKASLGAGVPIKAITANCGIDATVAKSLSTELSTTVNPGQKIAVYRRLKKDTTYFDHVIYRQKGVGNVMVTVSTSKAVSYQEVYYYEYYIKTI